MKIRLAILAALLAASAWLATFPRYTVPQPPQPLVSLPMPPGTEASLGCASINNSQTATLLPSPDGDGFLCVVRYFSFGSPPVVKNIKIRGGW